MTTLDAVKRDKPEPSAEEFAAKELVRMAAEQGLSLTGPEGLLRQFTKTVLETALNEEMTEHLGHEKHHAEPDRGSSNVRNGTRSKIRVDRSHGPCGDRGASGPGRDVRARHRENAPETPHRSRRDGPLPQCPWADDG